MPLICAIGQWVIEQACQQAAASREDGLGDLVVSVNVSARQLKDEDFPSVVERALKRSGLSAHLLELEITESMLMDGPDASLAKLNVLKQIGVRIAVDDVGTGYSNLAHLRRFRADRLKVDQSFVCGLTTDSDSSAIVSIIIALGRTMGLSTIAEGVETHREARALREFGCEEVQGYRFGKPMPAEQLNVPERRLFVTPRRRPYRPRITGNQLSARFNLKAFISMSSLRARETSGGPPEP